MSFIANLPVDPEKVKAYMGGICLMLPWNLLTASSICSRDMCSNGAVVKMDPSASCVVVDAPSRPIVSYSYTRVSSASTTAPAGPFHQTHLCTLYEACQMLRTPVHAHHYLFSPISPRCVCPQPT